MMTIYDNDDERDDAEIETSRENLPRPPIAVGRGPSGPSIEGPFCCAVRLCRALETKKKRKKVKNRKKIKKKEGKIEKKEKEMRKCSSVFLVSIYTIPTIFFCRAARLCRALEDP